MKRRYGVFQGLVLSLFSPAYYRDVARNWGGIGFVYLLLLLVLTWIPVLIHWQRGINRSIENDFPQIAKDFPKITIKAGKVSSDVDQPFEVSDPNGRLIFVLDTTGKIDSLDKTAALFLLTETQLHVRDQNNPNNRQLLPIGDMLQDAEISKEKLQEWLAALADWFGVAVFPFAMVGSLIRALVVMLIAGFVGMAFRSAFHADVTYGTLVRMAAMGITLPTYIDTGLILANTALPFYFLITLGLTSAYVAFGTNAAASGRPPAEPYDDLIEPPARRDEPRGDAPSSDAFRIK